jgi:hypothetical protein
MSTIIQTQKALGALFRLPANNDHNLPSPLVVTPGPADNRLATNDVVDEMTEGKVVDLINAAPGSQSPPTDRSAERAPADAAVALTSGKEPAER